MAKNKNIVAIYAELDFLLDTRLGTLQRMGLEFAEKALLGNYHTREADVFPDVDMEEYQRLYKSRDVETLRHSVVSEGIQLVKKLVNDIAEQAIVRPYYDGCKLVVNCYPYILANEELEELRNAIRVWTIDTVPVELIYEPIGAITPEHCKAYYGLMILYNPEEWFNTHMKALERTPMPEITLLTPSLYHRKKPTPDELDSTIKEAANPFQAFEWLAATIVELKFIEVEYVCVIKNRHTTPT